MIASDKDGLPPDISREIDLRIREDVAAHAIDATCRVVLNGRVERFLDRVEHRPLLFFALIREVAVAFRGCGPHTSLFGLPHKSRGRRLISPSLLDTKDRRAKLRGDFSAAEIVTTVTPKPLPIMITLSTCLQLRHRRKQTSMRAQSTASAPRRVGRQSGHARRDNPA